MEILNSHSCIPPTQRKYIIYKGGLGVMVSETWARSLSTGGTVLGKKDCQD